MCSTRQIIGGLLVALAGLASAQDVFDTGSSRASVALSVSVTVTESAQLRLDTTEIPFDLTGDNIGSDTLTCLRGPSPTDEISQVVDASTGAQRVFPLGTSYTVTDWPQLKVEGSSPITRYPPPARTEIDDPWTRRSDAFICYQSFLLRTFSTLSAWHISVERADVLDERPIESLYIDYGGCQNAPGRRGLFPLAPEQAIRLVADDAASAQCRDHLVVLGVKVQSEGAGEYTARLTYTLMSAKFEDGR